VGLVVSAPWGLITGYPADWAGRYYARNTKLLTINATPTVSFEVTPQIALGVGVQIEYAEAKLGDVLDIGTVGALFGIPGAVPGHDDGFANLKGEDWAYGFTLGALARPTPNLTLGLSYRSEIKHTFEAPLDFTLDSAGVGAFIRAATGVFRDTTAKADVPMPDVVSFGIRDTFLDHWTGLAEVDWTNWSLVHQLRIVAANPVQPPDITMFNWHDAWFGSLGVEYQYDDFWTFRAGTAYDESPVDNATREPRVPDASRIWLAAGASYHWNDATDVRVSFAHLFVLSGNVAHFSTQPGNTFRGVLIGSMNSYVNVIGVQFVYRD
jgi:long-chain fatty acid transport protein